MTDAELLEPEGFNAASTEPKGSDRPRTAGQAVVIARLLRALEDAQAAIAERDAEIARLREALRQIVEKVPERAVSTAMWQILQIANDALLEARHD